MTPNQEAQSAKTADVRTSYPWFAVDANLYPVRLMRVSDSEGLALTRSGEAAQLLPAENYTLTWATRHGITRWWLFARAEV